MLASRSTVLARRVYRVIVMEVVVILIIFSSHGVSLWLLKLFLENKELRRHVKVKHAGMDLLPGFTRAVLVPLCRSATYIFYECPCIN